MLGKIFWRIYDGKFPFRCALILVQNPLLKHVHPLYFGFMVGLFIRKGLIFPQNPFHKTHKDLSPGHCHPREITLPGKKNRKISCLTFSILVDFHISASTFRATLYPSYLNLCEFGCLEIWCCMANQTFHGKSAFSTHAESFGKYLKHFTRHLWTCKICTFVIVRYIGRR